MQENITCGAFMVNLWQQLWLKPSLDLDHIYHVYMCVYVYVCIERERNIEMYIHIYIYVYTHVYMCVYIHNYTYVYIYRERESERDIIYIYRERERYTQCVYTYAHNTHHTSHHHVGMYMLRHESTCDLPWNHDCATTVNDRVHYSGNTELCRNTQDHWYPSNIYPITLVHPARSSAPA